MMEKFRSELLSGLAGVLGQEHTDIVDRVLIRLLNK